MDAKGRLDSAKIFGLLKLNIQDPEWEKAMALLRESITVASRKAYLSVRAREEGDNWSAVTLDLAHTDSARLT